MRRAALLTLAASAAIAGCGGDDAPETTRVAGDTLTVYASLPAHGETAAAGAEAEAGMRKALADARRQAARRTVRLVVLPSTRPGDRNWDPGTVEANAERAAEDPTTIAYLGELDQGASAVSLPVTNSAGILQVSPADGLTSLTRTPPGRPRAGPERYYPDRGWTFARLVPPDREAAEAIVAEIQKQDPRSLVVLHGERIADRELESMVLARLGIAPRQEVTRITVRDGEPDQVPGLLEEVTAARPDAIVLAAAGGPDAAALLAALARRFPDVPLWGAPQLLRDGGYASVPESACAYTGVQGNARSLGYDAMRLVLEATDAAGPDRLRVVRAVRGGSRLRGPRGPIVLDARGDVTGRKAVCVPLASGR